MAKASKKMPAGLRKYQQSKPTASTAALKKGGKKSSAKSSGATKAKKK